jgi:hypothetical protein
LNTVESILEQIDRALTLYDERRRESKLADLSAVAQSREEVKVVVSATLERLAPPGSAYRSSLSEILEHRVGALKALRSDYKDGYLATVQGLIRGEVFDDFIEMAEHLQNEGYKDAAAVLVGGVLEDHLRALCRVRSIPVVVGDRPKKADAMNSELAATGAYEKLDQKSVTAWLDLRNKAANLATRAYTADQVTLMLAAVRDFILRVPAR